MQMENMEKERGLDKRNVREKEDEGEQRRRNYEKWLTVLVEIEGEDRITMMEVLKKVREDCGVVIGCRYKTPREYELTMEEERGKEKVLDGLKIKKSRIMAKEISSTEMVVSFLGLPTYIQDEEILRKLSEWGVTAVSRIKRRMWPGTEIADGTRFLKVKFTDTVKSLPYSTKFETVGGVEHFRVIHDRQVKVCRLCIQPGHVVRDCPSFKCFRCGKQGHYVRECNEGICNVCEMRTGLCVCEMPVEMEEEESEGLLSDLYEVDEEEENEEGEDSAAVEEVGRDTWSRKEETAEQRVIGRESGQEEVVSGLWQREEKEEKNGGNLELDEETSAKARYVKTSKGRRSEEGDGETTKSGRERQEGGNAKNQGTKLQEARRMKEKLDGGGGENEVLETSGTNVGEEMDTCEERNTQRKRKMKGTEECSGKK